MWGRWCSRSRGLRDSGLGARDSDSDWDSYRDVSRLRSQSSSMLGHLLGRGVSSAAAQCDRAGAGRRPTVDQLIALKRVGSPAISPDGKLVAYTVREANWDENAYETEIWIADVAAATTRQLTNGKKSSGSPSWSPDGARIAFTSDRSDKQQIWLIRPSFGEAEQLTREDEGVGTFAWSPDGKQIAFTMTDPKPEALEGPRQEVRRVRDRRRGPAPHAPLGDRRRVEEDEAPDEGRLHGRQLRLVARRQGRSPSTTRSTPTRRTAARPTSRSSRSRTRRSGRSSRRTARTTARSGRRTGRRSPSPRRWRSRSTTTRTATSRSMPAAGGADHAT